MAYLHDNVLDAALAYIVSNTTTLYICNALPTSYAQASSTYKLGTKTGVTVGSPADRSPNGRKVTVPATTAGTVNSTGTASHWAITSGSVLIAAGPLSANQNVTSGNQFTLDAIDIGIPDVA